MQITTPIHLLLSYLAGHLGTDEPAGDFRTSRGFSEQASGFKIGGTAAGKNGNTDALTILQFRPAGGITRIPSVIVDRKSVPPDISVTGYAGKIGIVRKRCDISANPTTVHGTLQRISQNVPGIAGDVPGNGNPGKKTITAPVNENVFRIVQSGMWPGTKAIASLFNQSLSIIMAIFFTFNLMLKNIGKEAYRIFSMCKTLS